MASEKAGLSNLSDVYQAQQPPPSYQQSTSAPQAQIYQPPIYQQPAPSIPPGMTVVNPATLTGYQTNGVTVVNHNVSGGPVRVVPVVGTTTVAVVVPAVGYHSTAIQCRACRQQVVTSVSYAPSFRTHLAAGILCLLGCWPCVFLPYCMDSCKSADHYCPNCNAYIGTYI